MSAPQAPLASSDEDKHPLLIANFRWLWSARLLAVLGSTAQAATIAWQIYEIARLSASIEVSALYLGLFGLAQFTAMFAMTIPAGIMVDRVDRRTIMLVTLVLQSVLSLIFLAYSYLPAPPIWGLFVLGAFQGALRAFLAPSTSSLGPMLVPRKVLPRAIAINSMAFQTGAIVGPAFGGLLLGFSTHIAYLVCAVLMIAATGLVLLIRADTKPEVSTESKMAMVKEGFAFIWNSKLLLGAMSLDLVAVLLGGAVALIPVFAQDVFQVEGIHYGLMRSAMPAGAIIVSLWLSQYPLRRHMGRWMYLSVAAFGLGTIVFGLSTHYYLSLAALAFVGAVDMVSVYTRQTLVQVITPDHMRGRVSSASLLFIGGSNELGDFETGVATRFLGPVGAVVFGGVGSIAAVGAWIKLFPQLWKADTLD